MVETTTVTVQTPGGQVVALPVVDLDGTAAVRRGGGEQQVAAGLPNLADAMAAVQDFSAGFRKAVQAVAPHKATVEFSMSFAVQAGKVIALFADGKAEGSVKVTLEWDNPRADPAAAAPAVAAPAAAAPAGRQ
jgi:hypothetical protein